MLRQKIKVQKYTQKYCWRKIPRTSSIWIDVIQKINCHSIYLEFPEAENAQNLRLSYNG